jgi:molecular chaperone DnaK
MGNRDYHVVYQGKKLNSELLSAMILKKLKQDAEKRIGPIANAVITVPYYFNDIRRKATQDAGKIAGLNVIDIINEPTAATLAYAWQKGEFGRADSLTKERTLLVYDLGGGTFDVTAVRYTSTNFKVLATDGDVMLGGLDWSQRLVDHLVGLFKKKYGEDPSEDPEAVMQFKQECESAKRKISKTTQVPISVYFKGKTLTISLTRKEYEQLTSDLLQRTKDTTELVMQQAGIGRGGFDDVLLVGGSTLMPVVEHMLREVTASDPSRELNPEEAVAQGAAIHAAILQAKETGHSSGMAQTLLKRLRAIKTSDVNSHSLGVKISDPENKARKINHIMIPRNTTIPFSVKQNFVTNVDDQERVHVIVLEGETSDPSACSEIGDFRVVDLPPNLPAGSPVEITYNYDSSGRIHVSAKELTSNKAASTEIVRSSGLADGDLDVFTELAESYSLH